MRDSLSEESAYVGRIDLLFPSEKLIVLDTVLNRVLESGFYLLPVKAGHITVIDGFIPRVWYKLPLFKGR
jgi:hypothetical protein